MAANGERTRLGNRVSVSFRLMQLIPDEDLAVPLPPELDDRPFQRVAGRPERAFTESWAASGASVPTLRREALLRPFAGASSTLTAIGHRIKLVRREDQVGSVQPDPIHPQAIAASRSS